MENPIGFLVQTNEYAVTSSVKLLATTPDIRVYRAFWASDTYFNA